MHPNEETIREFYEAFNRHDAEAMARAYADDVVFSDPVFTELHGEEARSMWRMLCERGKDLRLTASDIQADDTTGRAHWEAHYTFSATGQRVHNIIEARFVFRDGKIVRHTDSFDLRRWAGMALGWKGKLLGWLPPLQNAVRKQADKGLRIYMKKRG